MQKLCKTNQFITGDKVYQMVIESGVSEYEAHKFIGSLIRMAQAEGLIKKTSQCLASSKNRSSIQRLWQSLHFKGDIV